MGLFGFDFHFYWRHLGTRRFIKNKVLLQKSFKNKFSLFDEHKEKVYKTLKNIFISWHVIFNWGYTNGILGLGGDEWTESGAVT
jgi:hypothetical protein